MTPDKRTILQMTVMGPPVAWARARTTGTGEFGQKAFVTAPKQKRFKGICADFARLAMRTAKARGTHDGRPVPLGSPVVFEALVFLPIPASFSRADEQAARMGELRPTGKPDFDNWLKLPMDACEGIAYANDSQVVGFGDSAKLYSEKPRLEVHIYHADPHSFVATARGPPFPIEMDGDFEAMVCTGCGTTRTVAYVKHRSPAAFTCCPERRMIPVRELWRSHCEFERGEKLL